MEPAPVEEAEEPLLEEKSGGRTPSRRRTKLLRDTLLPSGAFGPNNRRTEICATITMVALTIGVSTVLGISLKEFIVDGHVSVGIDNHAHVQLEVPSVQVCPYSSEVSILSGPAAGSMKAYILQRYKESIPSQCAMKDTEAACDALTIANPDPCCCYPLVSGLHGQPDPSLGYTCETNDRLVKPCSQKGNGKTRQCYCLNLEAFSLHNIEGSADLMAQDQLEKGVMKETMEIRTSYTIDNENGKSDGHNALKVGLYRGSARNSMVRSFFYMDVGAFGLGSMMIQTYTQKDMWSINEYDLYNVQYTMMEENYARGIRKCNDMPPLFGNQSRYLECDTFGCSAALKDAPNAPNAPNAPSAPSAPNTSAMQAPVTTAAPATGMYDPHAAKGNFCTRFNFEYAEYFITRGVTFGSVVNIWAFLALLSVVATQLNNMNLINVLFPMRQKKTDARVVNHGLYFATCGCLRSTHTDEEASSSSDEAGV